MHLVNSVACLWLRHIICQSLMFQFHGFGSAVWLAQLVEPWLSTIVSQVWSLVSECGMAMVAKLERMFFTGLWHITYAGIDYTLSWRREHTNGTSCVYFVGHYARTMYMHSRNWKTKEKWVSYSRKQHRVLSIFDLLCSHWSKDFKAHVVASRTLLQYKSVFGLDFQYMNSRRIWRSLKHMPLPSCLQWPSEEFLLFQW